MGEGWGGEDIGMRAVIQRVKQARVRLEKKVIGEIEQGLLCFVGVGKGDQEADADYLAAKIPQLRIFEDAEGRFNRTA
jgi:D-tyrosyl-tRNA(Tyr) deacylase